MKLNLALCYITYFNQNLNVSSTKSINYLNCEQARSEEFHLWWLTVVFPLVGTVPGVGGRLQNENSVHMRGCEEIQDI